MAKQHTPALFFFLLLAVGAGIYGFWRANSLQKQLEASVAESASRQQALERETNARIATERQLETARQAMSAQDASITEILQRVHIIHDLELELTVESTLPESDTEPSKIPVPAIELRAADGRVWRFETQHEQPPTVERVGDVVRLAFRCVPLRLADLQGKPVEDLASVARLHTPYEKVLARVGYGVTPASTKRLQLRLNGLPVVDVVPTPISSDSWEYDVASGFAGISQRYQDQLRAQIVAGQPTMTGGLTSDR